MFTLRAAERGQQRTYPCGNRNKHNKTDDQGYKEPEVKITPA
jgi:hypothetical protein